MAGSQGPGAYEIYRSKGDIEARYPQLANWPTEMSLSIELTNFDIGKSELKPEHREGLWKHSLMSFDRAFSMAWSFGFHSHTGDKGFNERLSEQRAEAAMRYARTMRAPGVIIGGWKHTGVAWQKGMADGESGNMRKVLLVFLNGLPNRDPIKMGVTKTKR